MSHRHSWICSTCGSKKPLPSRAYTRKSVARWKAANPDRQKAITARYEAGNPHISLNGEQFRLRSLPEELRPLALQLIEARRQIRIAGGVNGRI